MIEWKLFGEYTKLDGSQTLLLPLFRYDILMETHSRQYCL